MGKICDGFFFCWMVFAVYAIYRYIFNPTDGSGSGFPQTAMGGWLESFRFVWESHEVIKSKIQSEGVNERSFLVSTPSRWVVVASNWGVLKELGSADERILSMQAAANERNATEYILSSDIHSDPYHVKIISKKLTSRIEALIPAVVDEVRLNFDENASIGRDWTPIHHLEERLSRCVSAITSLVVVGPHLCRDKEYIDCLMQLSRSISSAGLLCDLAPRVLKPLVAKLLVHQTRAFQTFLSKVKPLIEGRRSAMATWPDGWTEKPDDAIQWICDAALPSASLHELCMRILYINISAIHTTSTSIVQAVYDLAAHIEFKDPIRDEIKCALRSFGGWTKCALNKMHKLDSSLKESQRLHPVTIATMMRKAQRSCTLSDGTYLPSGRWVVVPAYSINRSAQWHAQPDIFDAFRFSRLIDREACGNRHALTNPGKGFLSFGIGKHACPGRFFAAVELKVMLAYIICNYDFKLDGNQRPRDKFFSFSCSPDSRVRLILKKSIDSSNPFQVITQDTD